MRVATAAFSRAFLLNRDDAAGRLVPVLRTLAPALQVDLERKAASPLDDCGAVVRYSQKSNHSGEQNDR